MRSEFSVQILQYTKKYLHVSSMIDIYIKKSKFSYFNNFYACISVCVYILSIELTIHENREFKFKFSFAFSNVQAFNFKANMLIFLYAFLSTLF